MSKGGLWCTWGRSYIVSPSTSGSLRAVRCAQASSSRWSVTPSQRACRPVSERVVLSGRWTDQHSSAGVRHRRHRSRARLRHAGARASPPAGALIVRHSTKSRGRPHRTAPGSTPFVSPGRRSGTRQPGVPETRTGRPLPGGRPVGLLSRSCRPRWPPARRAADSVGIRPAAGAGTGTHGSPGPGTVRCRESTKSWSANRLRWGSVWIATTNGPRRVPGRTA